MPREYAVLWGFFRESLRLLLLRNHPCASFRLVSHQFPFESGNPDIFTLRTTAQGKPGALPFTPEQLATAPSGDLFGWSQNVGMGWSPENLGGDRPDVESQT